MIANETMYRNANGTGDQTISASYTWYTGTLQPEQITLTLPTVTTGQNGPNTASTITGVFDRQDHLIWHKDPNGILRYLAYDPSSEAAITYLEDVDSTQTSDFSNLPSGWSTPSGGGQHRKTTAEVDWLGRITRVTDPLGTDHFAIYNDVNREVRYYLGWNPSTNRPTGPTWVERDDPVRSYRELFSISATPDVSVGRPTGTEANTGLQSLLRIGLNKAGQPVQYDAYFDFGSLTYGTSATLGTLNTNYYRTAQSYDDRGYVNRVVSAAGTISRIVNDSFGRPLSTWIGTNDTPTSGYWSPSNPAGMTQLASATYDANGNQDSVTLIPGSGQADRVTETYYDWRNRPVLIKEGVESSESTSTNRPLWYVEYDNLNQITRSKLYDGDAVDVTISNGVPDAPSSSLLRAQGEASYDELGRLYEMRQYGVSSGGTPTSAALTTQAWYNRLGQAVKIARPGGLVEKIQYDSVGRPITQSWGDGGGDSTWADALLVVDDLLLAQQDFAYNSRDELIQVTSRDRFHNASGTGSLGTPTTGVNARVNYAGFWYDNLGRLTDTASVGTNGGSSWTRPGSVPSRSDTVLVSSQTFDDAGNVYEVTDPLGIVTRTSYDRLGRMTSQTAAQGMTDAFTVSFAYSANGLTSITAPGSRTTEQGFDSWGRVNSLTEYVGTAFERTTSWTMDNLGQTQSVTDDLSTDTLFSYDVLGRMLSTTEADGTSVERTTSATYDVFGRMLTLTDPRSNTWTMSYDDVARTVSSSDPLSNTSTTEFDQAGNAVEWTDALSHSSTASYDLLGRLTSFTDPLSQTTSFQYNVSGTSDVTVDALAKSWTTVYDRFGRTSEVIDPLSRSVEYGYDRNSQVVSFTDAKGTPTELTYDNLGRVTEITEAVGYTEERSTSYTYSSAGDLATMVNPRGYTTAYSYDAAGRISSVTAASGETIAQTVSVEYDDLDRVVSVTRPGSRETAYTYDELSQVTKVTEGVGTKLERSSTFIYDANGNQTKLTNPLSFSTSTTYDKLNRPLTQTDANGGVTTLGYDAVGQLLSIEDPTGNESTFTYDAAGQLTGETDPLGKTTSYAYDAVGQLTKITDRLGRERRFSYDDAGQMTAEDWYTSGTKVQSQTFGYDLNGNLTSATDPDGSYTMSYDRLNRTTSVVQPFGLTLSMAYDANDNRVSVSDSAGGSQTSTYDALDRLTLRQMSNSGQDPIRVTWAYNSAGENNTLTREAKVSGTWATTGVTTQTFDDLGRRTNIRHADASNTTLGEYGYSFDAGDRITNETINGTTRTYGYDDINQLTSDNGTSLSYDKSGNRTMSGYTVGAGNRLLSDGTWNYTYNDEGQITSKASATETWNYTYDHAGQMTQASQVGGDTVNYSFDAFGNRLQRDVTSGSTTTTERFAYDGWDTAKPGAIGSENFDVYADLNSSNAVTNRRLFGPGFDEPLARQSASGVVGWYGTDQLGSVRMVFDNSGTVTATRSYSGFGEIVSETGTGLDRYAYTAREWDSAIGLQYSRARMYDPRAGRWTSEDPIGFAAGDNNLSRYVGNGATLARDPSGLDSIQVGGKSCGDVDWGMADGKKVTATRYYYFQFWNWGYNWYNVDIGEIVQTTAGTFVKHGKYMVSLKKLQEAVNAGIVSEWQDDINSMTKWFADNHQSDMSSTAGGAAVNADKFAPEAGVDSTFAINPKQDRAAGVSQAQQEAIDHYHSTYTYGLAFTVVTSAFGKMIIFPDGTKSDTIKNLPNGSWQYGKQVYPTLAQATDAVRRNKAVNDLMATKALLSGGTKITSGGITEFSKAVARESGGKVTVQDAKSASAPSVIKAFKGGAAAVFHAKSDGTGVIYVRPGASLSSFWHEYVHFQHFKEIGAAAYIALNRTALGKLSKEKRVMDYMLQPYVWERMSKAEREMQIESLTTHMIRALHANEGLRHETAFKELLELVAKANSRLNDKYIPLY